MCVRVRVGCCLHIKLNNPVAWLISSSALVAGVQTRVMGSKYTVVIVILVNRLQHTLEIRT